MKKLFKKALCIFLCTVMILTLFYGCSKEPEKINFIYPFSGDVDSYDPQVAETADEFLIIENTFEGLVRINDDGKVVPAAAEKWEISNDGLTYTFYLQKGLKWNIDTETDENGEREEDDRLEYMGYDFNPDITAHDFVFGLRRAVQPETNCPLFSSVSCIKNAGEIHSGKKKSTELGVNAVDDYTLQITLSTADESFMYSLTSAAAMPWPIRCCWTWPGSRAIPSAASSITNTTCGTMCAWTVHIITATPPLTGAGPMPCAASC